MNEEGQIVIAEHTGIHGHLW